MQIATGGLISRMELDELVILDLFVGVISERAESLHSLASQTNDGELAELVRMAEGVNAARSRQEETDRLWIVKNGLEKVLKTAEENHRRIVELEKSLTELEKSLTEKERARAV